MANNDKQASRLVVLSTVSFYLVAAIAMILANKWVLKQTEIPLFFLFVQLVFSVALLALSHLVGLIKISFWLDKTTCKALAPLIAINVLGLNFNNLTLKYVDASFYQVARGLVLPITVGFSSLLLSARPSMRILGSCAVVTAGFFVGVLIDTPSTAYWGRNGAGASTGIKAPSLIGVAFGVLSSVSTALHAVVIKRSLDAVGGSTLQLAWYSNLLSSLVMVPIFLFAGELPGIASLLFGIGGRLRDEGSTELETFLWGSTITGVVGFLICIAGFLSIKITSPITHMVSSAVRGVVLTLLSVAVFGDIITTGRASSIAIILIGSIYYTWVKNAETIAQRREPSISLPTVSSDKEQFLPHRTNSMRHEDEEANKLENGGNGDYQLHVRQPTLAGGQLTPEVGRNSVLG